MLVLLQVTDNFDRQDFNKMCWTLCARKNLNQSKLIISNDDAFKIWCIFNFLSEDQYPLVIIMEEVSVGHLLPVMVNQPLKPSCPDDLCSGS